MSVIKKAYDETIKTELMSESNYKSIMEVPKLDKIVLNMGLGQATDNSKIIDEAVEEMKLISGQQPVVTKAKNSIAGFKLRENQPIGVKVTLRGKNMYNFLDKLVMVALPRVRDFQGISPKAFDGRGNYTLGITEQLIFPEIDYDKVNKIKGMDITLVTTAKTNEEALALLTKIGMPFKKKGV
ncbi:MAG: 50S ribosomal protein L5 [Mycoplasmatales bacterium]